MPRERRHRLQIYREILSAIELEMMNDGHVKPTRVQHLANMSYDKLQKYLLELDKYGLLSMKDSSIQITDRGREFLKSYDNLVNFMHTMGLDY